MTTYADAVLSGGNPSPGFSLANLRSGFSPEYICRKLCPLRRPQTTPPRPRRAITLDSLIDGPGHAHASRRQRGKAHAYTITCPQCGVTRTFHTEDTAGHERIYCNDECELAMRLARGRETYRKTHPRKVRS